jgi:MFS family permease
VYDALSDHTPAAVENTAAEIRVRVVGGRGETDSVTPTKPERPRLASFWSDLPRDGKLLLSVVVFQFIGTGLVLPFWVVYLHEVRGFGLDTTGLLLGVIPLGGFLASIPAGAAIDRFGARRVMLVCLAINLAGQLVMTYADTLPRAVVGLALNGMAFGVGWPGIQSLIANVIPSEIRQRYFGMHFSLLNLGIGIGGIIGGFVVDVDRLWTFQAMYLGDAASYLPAMLLLLVPLRHTGGPAATHEEGSDAPRGSYLAVLRGPAVPSLVALTVMSAFVGYGQLNTGLPAYARVVSEVSTRGLGFAFAANTLVIVLLQLVVLQRIEGHRRTRVVILMSLVWAMSWLCLGASGLVPGTVGATLLVAACASVFALGETLLQPTLPAIVNDLAPDQLRGRYNALTSSIFQLASVAAPPVAGFFIDRGWPSAYIGTLLAGSVVVAFLSLRLEPQLSPEANGLRPAPDESTPDRETVSPPAPITS